MKYIISDYWDSSLNSFELENVDYVGFFPDSVYFLHCLIQISRDGKDLNFRYRCKHIQSFPDGQFIIELDSAEFKRAVNELY